MFTPRAEPLEGRSLFSTLPWLTAAPDALFENPVEPGQPMTAVAVAGNGAAIALNTGSNIVILARDIPDEASSQFQPSQHGFFSRVIPGSAIDITADGKLLGADPNGREWVTDYFSSDDPFGLRVYVQELAGRAGWNDDVEPRAVDSTGAVYFSWFSAPDNVHRHFRLDALGLTELPIGPGSFSHVTDSGYVLASLTWTPQGTVRIGGEFVTEDGDIGYLAPQAEDDQTNPRLPLHLVIQDAAGAETQVRQDYFASLHFGDAFGDFGRFVGSLDTGLLFQRTPFPSLPPCRSCGSWLPPPSSGPPGFSLLALFGDTAHHAPVQPASPGAVPTDVVITQLELGAQGMLLFQTPIELIDQTGDLHWVSEQESWTLISNGDFHTAIGGDGSITVAESNRADVSLGASSFTGEQFLGSTRSFYLPSLGRIKSVPFPHTDLGSVVGDVLAADETPDGRLHVLGMGPDGILPSSGRAAFRPHATFWYDDALAIHNAELLTPESIASGFDAMTTSWSAVHFAALNTAGDVIIVWTAPTMGERTWRADNLSAIVRELHGSDALPALTGNLAAIRTAWDGLQVSATDASGQVRVLWWSPTVGPGGWQVAGLTEATGGPTLSPGSLASWVSPWGGLNLVGRADDGSIWAYWWAPGQEAWAAEPIANASDLNSAPAGGQPLHASSGLNGNASIVTLAENGDVLRFFWRPEFGTTWQTQNVTQDTIARFS